MSSTSHPDEHPREAIELKYASVYKTPEWQSLDEVDRAQLMLVAEGVKPGTIIHGDFTDFQKILGQLGLESFLTTEPGVLYPPAYMVAKPEVLNRYFREGLIAPENAGMDEDHRIMGRFLGYPECCTKEYNNPRKNKDAKVDFSSRRFVSNFKYELEKEIDETGTYPEELDFCPPAFTPCGAHCEAALTQLRKWREIMEAGDPKAARELQLYHWRIEPFDKAHKQEVDKIDSERLMEDKIAQMRDEILGLI